MSKVYVVSYDLNKSGQDYEGLYGELKKSPAYWHYLDSTWLIYTSESANELYDRIGGHIDRNDLALVIEVRRNYQGWLPEKAWEWIRQHVSFI
ncbi:SinR family protein [Sphingobacterium ginsenosidimutans]|uniref:SinR family protein n=1 Tax=Sphingobacterium ginsenosidimutans TaxID=687845 RepID=A0ABP7ZQL9_9SPHI